MLPFADWEVRVAVGRLFDAVFGSLGRVRDSKYACFEEGEPNCSDRSMFIIGGRS